MAECLASGLLDGLDPAAVAGVVSTFTFEARRPGPGAAPWFPSPRVRQRFAAIPELRLHTPTHPELHGFLTAFRLPATVDAPALRKALWQRRIETPIVERPDGFLVRVSTHFYNTTEEIDRLAEVLAELLR